MADKRIQDLDPIATGDVLPAAVWEIENVGGAVPESRKLDQTQMATLFSGGGGGGARVPFIYNATGTHTVSAGVTKIDIECVGGGGGTSTTFAPGSPYCQGGGSAFGAVYNQTVIAADVIAITVGDPGGNDFFGGAAGDGTNSEVTLAGGITPVVTAAHVYGAQNDTNSPGAAGLGMNSLGDVVADGQYGILIDLPTGAYKVNLAGHSGAGPYGMWNGCGGSTGGGRVIVWEYQ